MEKKEPPKIKYCFEKKNIKTKYIFVYTNKNITKIPNLCVYFMVTIKFNHAFSI